MGRWVVRLLAVAGGVGVLGVALQFGGIPWKVHAFLARDGAEREEGEGWRPTHILVLGGSGVPGESALMRLWYAAEAARENPGIPVWMALPCGENDAGDSAAVAYAGELRLRGVEAERCAPRACGNNTREQAVGLVRALGEESGKGSAEAARVLLVTSPEHVRRACLAVRRAAREAGAVVEVRGRGAENVSLEDHREKGEEVGEAGVGTAVVGAVTGKVDGGGMGAVRYEFWNHARYTLDAAREGVALLYYWGRGWI